MPQYTNVYIMLRFSLKIVRFSVLHLSQVVAVQYSGKTTDGIAVTSAGNLPSRCIIHLANPPAHDRKGPTSKDWQQRITKCMEETESMKMQSIAFPLLGTGKSHSAVRIISFHKLQIASFCCILYINTHTEESTPSDFLPISQKRLRILIL